MSDKRTDHVTVSGSHPAPDAILDLAAGLSPPDERSSVLDHLKSCAECEVLFRDVARDLEIGRVQAVDLDLDASNVVVARPAASNRLRWISLAPLAAAAVLAFSLIGRDPGSGGLEPGFLPAPGQEVRQRDVGEEADPVLASGIDAYLRGDWNAAVDRLTDAAPEMTLWSVRDVYLGNALAHLGRDAEARDVLAALPARTLPDPWGSEARWTLMVVHRRLGERDRADALLRELAGEPGDVGERARRFAPSASAP